MTAVAAYHSWRAKKRPFCLGVAPKLAPQRTGVFLEYRDSSEGRAHSPGSGNVPIDNNDRRAAALACPALRRLQYDSGYPDYPFETYI